MANYRNRVVSYDSARQVWAQHVKIPQVYIHIDKNTWLHYDAQWDAFVVMYHSTPIVTYYFNGAVELCSGGWRSGSALRRINDYSPLRITVWTGGRHWYVDNNETGGTLPFDDGMLIP